jgi:glycosyltransferase involved in cell wall biosynthesis
MTKMQNIKIPFTIKTAVPVDTDFLLKKALDEAYRAEKRAVRAERELHHLYGSPSWKIARAIVILNPKHWRYPARLNIRIFLKNRVSRALTQILNLPYLPNFFKNTLTSLLGINETKFTILPFESYQLYFHQGHLTDDRGLGRVSRELLNQLIAYSKKVPWCGKNLKRIYFYSSIHSCPDVLPSPSLVMIHDVIPLLFPELYPKPIVDEWRLRFKRIAKQAFRIIAISKSSATDVAKTFNIPLEKIDVIHNGITELPVKKNPLISLPYEPYLVYLGSFDHHKNIEVVLKALARPEVSRFEMIMIGNNHSFQKQVCKLGLGCRVHFIGVCNDGDVGYLIQNALALVCPSLSEGFGLPPLEAALLGVPSICSDRAAMTELLENAALFVDPHSPEAWAKAILKLDEDPEFRKNLGAKAQQKASEFQWEKSVEKLLTVFKQFIEKSPAEKSSKLKQKTEPKKAPPVKQYPFADFYK